MVDNLRNANLYFFPSADLEPVDSPLPSLPELLEAPPLPHAAANSISSDIIAVITRWRRDFFMTNTPFLFRLISLTAY
ncbi:hypothetical protein PAV_4c02580 [Paenibacillus alvei DSM 29]|nr:hypothetical protein PAV_4c02580 [Paenibacillus alvei DSM 29]